MAMASKLSSAKCLVQAINDENISQAEALLIEGACPNLLLPAEGVTPFHLAVGCNSRYALHFTTLFLQYDADPNVRSTEGLTPVHVAASWGRFQALELLLWNGGDPSLKDEDGNTAKSMAESSGHWDCINILEAWMNRDQEEEEEEEEDEEGTFSDAPFPLRDGCNDIYGSMYSPRNCSDAQVLNNLPDKRSPVNNNYSTAFSWSPGSATSSTLSSEDNDFSSRCLQQHADDLEDYEITFPKQNATSCSPSLRSSCDENSLDRALLSMNIDNYSLTSSASNRSSSSSAATPSSEKTSPSRSDTPSVPSAGEASPEADGRTMSGFGLDVTSPDHTIVFAKTPSKDRRRTVFCSLSSIESDEYEESGDSQSSCSSKEGEGKDEGNIVPESVSSPVEHANNTNNSLSHEKDSSRSLFSLAESNVNEMDNTDPESLISTVDCKELESSLSPSVSDEGRKNSASCPVSMQTPCIQSDGEEASLSLFSAAESGIHVKDGDRTDSESLISASASDEDRKDSAFCPLGSQQPTNGESGDKDASFSLYSIQERKVEEEAQVVPEALDVSSASSYHTACGFNTFHDAPASDTSTKSVYYHRKSGASLIERHLLPASGSEPSLLDFSFASSDDTVVYDWTSFKSDSIDEEDAHRRLEIPPELAKLTNEEIKKKLCDLGEDVGPVTSTTRSVYLSFLVRLMQDDGDRRKRLKQKQDSSKLDFKYELAEVLNGTTPIPDCGDLEKQMVEQFQDPDPKRKWREGRLKSSFNYLLLDPRVTRDLPTRYPKLTELETFKTFVSGIFYVGKGKRSRPYAHFEEALDHAKKKMTKKPGAKVLHILDVWSGGMGVVSLHCFQNVIPVEAYTREACMIDALGMSRLTNAKRGDYYGVAHSWSGAKKRKIGVHLLHKACQIFLMEGERQIRSADITSGQ